jgi:DNA polymerase-3 subunit delta'
MWGPIRGHDAVVERFRRSLARGRLASTFLFVGPAGVGKMMFARRLAQALLCREHDEQQLEPCLECPSCRQVQAGAHPDLTTVAKPADRNFIPIELLIGDREHRMQEGLCHDVSLKPSYGGRKIALLDDADFLNQEGANCLLKTLEEPPPNSLIVLVGATQQKFLPTIRSRCQVVRFAPLSCDDVTELLLVGGYTQDREEATCWAQLADGSVARAIELGGSAMRDFRSQLLDELGMLDRKSLDLARQLNAFVEEAGKEAPPRRDRLRQVIGIASHYYGQLMREIVGRPATADPMLAEIVRRDAATWPGTAETAATCLQRCHDAEADVAANASLPTVIDAWLDDVAQIILRSRA